MTKLKELLNKIISPWLSLPYNHKKRFLQSIGLYLVIIASISVWIFINSESTIKNLEKKLPKVTVNITDGKAVDNLEINNPADNKGFKKPLFNYGNIAYEQKYISIIISGLGISKSLTMKAIEGENTLPKSFSLAFSPYAPNVEELIKTANNSGFKTIILAPMDSVEYPKKDAGARALSSRFSDDKNKENMDWILSRGNGSIAVMNFMGSRFLSDKKRLEPNLKIIKDKEFMFIENPTGVGSKADIIAKNINLPYIRADLEIGDILNKNKINEELSKLEDIANKKGYAVAIVKPYPFIFDILKTWSKKLFKRDIILTNVKTLWSKRIKK